jgi:hypothetical protein
MILLLAAIGAICVAVLLWRAFVSNPAEATEHIARPSRGRPGPLAPDDDPEFLRKLGQHKPPPSSDADGAPPA